MKILIAPNAFKGSLGSPDVARLLSRGIRSIDPNFEVESIALADGGDGTLEVMVSLWEGFTQETPVHDPLGRPIRAAIGFDRAKSRAVIEMARASGLALLSNEERNPLLTSSHGTGELILATLEAGVREVYLGIGGSATNDGGAGMAAALGFLHVDKNGKTIQPNGGTLDDIAKILPPREPSALERLKVTVLCDVTNPLCGEDGASRVYGAQKGATPEQVEQLDRSLLRLSEIWKRDLGRDVAKTPGSGAAGGMGGGAMAYLGAELVSGTKVVFAMTDIEEKVKESDRVVTGEGTLDRTSLVGKIPGRVANLARKYNKPCYGVCGVCPEPDPTVFHEAGFTDIWEIAPSEISIEERILNAPEWVFQTGVRIGGMFLGD